MLSQTRLTVMKCLLARSLGMFCLPKSSYNRQEGYEYRPRRMMSVDHGTSSQLQPLHHRRSEIVDPLGRQHHFPADC
ncbi:hypothetical protein TNCV_3780641 [Trichonephila clavipes]|nr:hypothetical protein TNCV_3780641 [Trichonephila clavipes]